MTRPPVDLTRRWVFPTPLSLRAPGCPELLLFDLPGQHVAAFDLVLRRPLALEPEEAEGVATVALHAVDEGTHTHPDGRITELLELQGAALHGTASMGFTRLGGDAPAHRMPEVLRLFAEILQEPQYHPDDVAHHVEAQVAAHESRTASPTSATRQAFRAALFGRGNREGRPAPGTPATLQAVSPELVNEWHHRHWTTTDATLVVAGDLSTLGPDELLGSLRHWRREGRPTPYPRPTPAPPRTVVVPMPGAVQATIVVGTVTAGRSDPDWAALKLGGHAMAGAFSSRLNVELRERLGYTYGIQGGFTARQADGLFQVAGSTRTEVAADALRRILGGLSLGDAFTEAEVADAQAHLIGIAPLANETAGDIARQATALVAAGEDVDFVNRHFDAMAAVTADLATAAFRRHVDPERLTITVGGDAAELVPALTALGLDPAIADD